MSELCSATIFIFAWLGLNFAIFNFLLHFGDVNRVYVQQASHFSHVSKDVNTVLDIVLVWPLKQKTLVSMHTHKKMFHPWSQKIKFSPKSWNRLEPSRPKHGKVTNQQRSMGNPCQNDQTKMSSMITTISPSPATISPLLFPSTSLSLASPLMTMPMTLITVVYPWTIPSPP